MTPKEIAEQFLEKPVGGAWKNGEDLARAYLALVVEHENTKTALEAMAGARDRALDKADLVDRGHGSHTCPMCRREHVIQDVTQFEKVATEMHKQLRAALPETLPVSE